MGLVLQSFHFFFNAEFFAFESRQFEAIGLGAVAFVGNFLFEMIVLHVETIEVRLNCHSRVSITVL